MPFLGLSSSSSSRGLLLGLSFFSQHAGPMSPSSAPSGRSQSGALPSRLPFLSHLTSRKQTPFKPFLEAISFCPFREAISGSCMSCSHQIGQNRTLTYLPNPNPSLNTTPFTYQTLTLTLPSPDPESDTPSFSGTTDSSFLWNNLSSIHHSLDLFNNRYRLILTQP